MTCASIQLKGFGINWTEIRWRHLLAVRRTQRGNRYVGVPEQLGQEWIRASPK